MRYHHLLPNIHVIACDYLCRRINVEYSINNGIIYIITLCELLCCEENCRQEGVCFGPVLAVPLYFMLGERRVDYGPTGNEFLMLAKSLIQFRDNNANNFNIPHDFNLNFQTMELRMRLIISGFIRARVEGRVRRRGGRRFPKFWLNTLSFYQFFLRPIIIIIAISAPSSVENPGSQLPSWINSNVKFDEWSIQNRSIYAIFVTRLEVLSSSLAIE